MSSIARHLTAIERCALSRPVQLAVADGVIRSDRSVFDYGCGRGGDVARLSALGIPCAGWDPVHRANGVRSEADVVTLSYVVNVIEDPLERVHVLRAAWTLARSVLVVAARLETEERPSTAIDHQDGFVTQRGTFQKLYQQHELRDWIESTLAMPTAPAGPGMFYVFRDDDERQRLIVARHCRHAAAPRIGHPSELYERHRDILRPLFDFLCYHGRPPHPEEFASAQPILDVFGTIGRAIRVLRSVVDEQQWSEVADGRTQDLLVYLALTRFRRRPRLSELPMGIQRDIRTFFTSYQAACELADALLFSLGEIAQIDSLCKQSRIGKLTPSALYIHCSAVNDLDPVLRIYEGCAHSYIGAVEGANLIKLHRHMPIVSYLVYPDFDTDPHPALQSSLLVRLQAFQIEVRQYNPRKNPPILHRKETFVSADYPLREKFKRLTVQEERFGLYAAPAQIGTRDGWLRVLREKGVALRGHRVVRIGNEKHDSKDISHDAVEEYDD